ncbi:MAG: hypothetical protein ACAH83_17395 [Alphaproteobacteria bacterium]
MTDNEFGQDPMPKRKRSRMAPALAAAPVLMALYVCMAWNSANLPLHSAPGPYSSLFVALAAFAVWIAVMFAAAYLLLRKRFGARAIALGVVLASVAGIMASAYTLSAYPHIVRAVHSGHGDYYAEIEGSSFSGAGAFSQEERP